MEHSLQDHSSQPCLDGYCGRDGRLRRSGRGAKVDRGHGGIKIIANSYKLTLVMSGEGQVSNRAGGAE